jgi:hypothetical protein
MALSILAAGGDPTRLEVKGEKVPIDLVAEFTYNRGEKASLGKQGINGWLWALILLDSMRYEIPESAFYQREDMIQEILSLQKISGGFALAGETADPDITAMTIQALSPYYESETQYTYFRVADQQTVTGTVRQAVDEALAFLSLLQLDTGDFRSFGNPNSQTSMQVVIALTSIGLDPQTLNEFIKGGNTLVNGMLRYRMPDGGFSHMLPASVSNGKASEQALCAVAALIRQKRGEGTFYDFRPASVDTQQRVKDSSVDSGYIVMLVAAVILFPILLITSIALIRKKKWIPLVVLLVAALAVGWFFYRLDIQSPDDFFLENTEVISPGSRTAFIRIDCSAILEDPKRIPTHLSDFRILPEDGVILPETEYLLPEGATAFDLLMKAVRYQKIQIDFRGNPENRTGAVYVRSIGHLYEFACGPLSGWLFKVNDEFSDNDSSKTVLEDKDRVEWIYTCDLGRDIGNEFKDESREISNQTGGS